jgi:ATP:corrinoid adenosyltransferase
VVVVDVKASPPTLVIVVTGSPPPPLIIEVSELTTELAFEEAVTIDKRLF